MTRTAVVSGASGFIGSALVVALEGAGWTVRRLVRHSPRTPLEIAWDPDRDQLDPASLVDVDVVVHLAGENIGHRWTMARRQRIRDSRIRGTTLIAGALVAAAKPRGNARPSRPADGSKVLVSASAIGIYGDRGDEELDEGSRPGHGFLADVCRAWEAATAPAEDAGIRVVHIRNGVVLGSGGGAFPRMVLPFRFGLGGRLGSGHQWFSWIALGDVVRAIQLLMEHELAAGPVNLVAPTPVRNRELTGAMADAVGLPALFPVPATALRLAFGQMADEALLASQRVVPSRLASLGFEFGCPTIGDALQAAMNPASRGR